MEFDRNTTLAIFLALVAVGVGGLAGSGVMATGTVLMMVLPSVLVFGAVCLFLGVRWGEYRATR
jgi:hypothetical protein